MTFGKELILPRRMSCSKSRENILVTCITSSAQDQTAQNLQSDL